MRTPSTACGQVWRVVAFLLAGAALVSCFDPAPPPATPVGAPTPAPTATLPPTSVPGSLADQRDVTETVRQFGAAVIRADQVVALLVLSPSAQQVVAASTLNDFLGRGETPDGFVVRAVQLQGDVAVAECGVRYDEAEQTLRLQLVRLEGVWKIDAQMPAP